MSKHKKIALFGTEPVIGKIGGLGIRQLEISRELNRHFEVRLFTPFPVTKHKESFKIQKINYEKPETIESQVRWADIVYSSHPIIGPFSRKYHKPLVVDLLVHEYFEDLERFPLKDMKPLEQSAYFSNCIVRLTQQLAMGDFFLCPSQRSRDYYLGVLTFLGKLLPKDYSSDPCFRSLIDVVPFGIPKQAPKKDKNLLRGKVPGVGPKDFLIIWGGSLANWFDCLTPIRAMARLKKNCPRAKLVFTGNMHPVQNKLPHSYEQVIRLAKKNGTYNKNVFFFTDWVSFDQHDYYLSEADAGLVTFFNHIENHFSFRIRMVDYLWGNLPILTNPDNTLSDLIEQEKVGYIIPFGNDKSLADKIEWMAAHPAECRKLRQRISETKKHFYWDKVLKPLVDFCHKPQKAPTLFNNVSLLNGNNFGEWYGFTEEQMLQHIPAHPYLRPLITRQKLEENKKEEARNLMKEHLHLFDGGLQEALFRLSLFDIPIDLTYEELLSVLPSNRYVRLIKAKQEINNEKFDAASGLIREEVNLYGQSPETSFCTGLLHQRRGFHKKAIDEFKKVRKEIPNRYECWLPLADSLVETGKSKSARNLYTGVWDRATNWRDEWVRCRAAVSLTKLDADRYPEHETLNQFLKLDPHNEGIAYAKASAFERAGKVKQARHLFKKYSQEFKDDLLQSAALFRLALLSRKSRQENMLKKCLELHPSHTGAKRMLEELRKK